MYSDTILAACRTLSTVVSVPFRGLDVFGPGLGLLCPGAVRPVSVPFRGLDVFGRGQRMTPMRRFSGFRPLSGIRCIRTAFCATTRCSGFWAVFSVLTPTYSGLRIRSLNTSQPYHFPVLWKKWYPVLFMQSPVHTSNDHCISASPACQIVVPRSLVSVPSPYKVLRPGRKSEGKGLAFSHKRSDYQQPFVQNPPQNQTRTDMFSGFFLL